MVPSSLRSKTLYASERRIGIFILFHDHLHRKSLLFHECVYWQTVYVNSPVWPSRTFPLFASMQTRRDLDVLPSCVEASFVQINLRDLGVDIVADLSVGAETVVPPKLAVLSE